MSQATQNRMTKDMLLYLPAKIIEGLVGIYSISFLTSKLTTGAYGDFLAINTAVNFAFVIFCAWIQNSAVRFAVEQTSTSDGKKTFYTTMFVTWVCSTLPILLIGAVAATISGKVILLLSSLMFFAYSSFQMLSSVLIQLRKSATYIILSLFSTCGKLFLVFLLTLNVPAEGASSPLAVICAYSAIDIAAFLTAAVILGFFTNLSVKSFTKENALRFAKYGFPLIGISFSIGLLNISDRFLVELLCGSESLAVYGANYSIASSVFTMLMTGIMRAVYQPMIKALKDSGQEEAMKMLSGGVRLFLLVAVPAAAGLCALCRPIGELIFDKPEYMNGVISVVFVSIGMIFLGVTEYCNKPFEIVSNTLPILVSSFIAAAFNIVANIVTLPIFGFIAAAVNTLLAYVLYFILAYVRGQRVLRWKFPLKSLIRILISAAVCGIGAYLVTLLPIGTVAKLLLAVIVGASAYAVMLIVLREADNELAMIKSLLKKFKKV